MCLLFITPLANGATCDRITRGTLSDVGVFVRDPSSGTDYLISCTGNNEGVDDAEFDGLLDNLALDSDDSEIVENDSSRAVINLSGIDLSFDWGEHPDPDPDEPKFKGGAVFTGSNVRYIRVDIGDTEDDLNHDLNIVNYATVMTGVNNNGGISVWVADPSTTFKVILRNYGEVATDGNGSRHDAVEASAEDADAEVYNESQGRITTSGDAARGLYANSETGFALAVNRGFVSTSGDTMLTTFEGETYQRRSYGVYAWTGGDSARAENHDTVTTSGDGASGVSASTESSSGTAEVRNHGTVTTTGDTVIKSDITVAAYGLNASTDGSGNATVVNERTGTVTTRGTGARGLNAYSNSGTAKSVNRGTVRTSGGIHSGLSELWRVSVGVSASSDGGDSSSENRGKITTTGTGARGMSASSDVGSVQVRNYGTVITTGGTVHDADEIATPGGIAAFGIGGTGGAIAKNERGGSIDVSGAGAKGIWSLVYSDGTGDAYAENSGTVTTRGNAYVADRTGTNNDSYRGAAGVSTYAQNGNATSVNSAGGTITTRGKGAPGLAAWTDGVGATARVSNSGKIRVRANEAISTIPGNAAEKKAAQSHGMVAVALKGNANLSLSGGTVTAAGGGSGLHALTGSDGEITVTMKAGAQVKAPVAASFVGGETGLKMTGGSRLIGAVNFGNGVDVADLTGSEIRGDISFGGGSDGLILRAGAAIIGDMNFGGHSGNIANAPICGTHERGDVLLVNVERAADAMAVVKGDATGLERLCKQGGGAVLVDNASMHGVRAAIENGTLVVKGHMDLGSAGMLTVYDRSKLQFEVGDLSTQANNHGRITAGGGTTFADDDSDGNNTPNPNLELAFADLASTTSARGKTITVISGPVTGLSTGTSVGVKGGSTSVGTTSVTGSGSSMSTSVTIASNASLTFTSVPVRPDPPASGVTCGSVMRGSLGGAGVFAPNLNSGSDYIISCTGDNDEVDPVEFVRLLDLADVPDNLVDDDSSRSVINLSGIDLSIDLGEYPDPMAGELKFKGGVVFTGSNIRYIDASIGDTEDDLNRDLNIVNYATVKAGGGKYGGVSSWVADPNTSHKVVLRNYGQVASDGDGSRHDGVEVSAENADVEVYNEQGGRITTSGDAARGLQASSEGGNSSAVNRGNVATSGDPLLATFEGETYQRRAYGVYAWTGGGNASANNHGTVTTSGGGARGVSATTESMSGTAEVRNHGTVTTTGNTVVKSGITVAANGLNASTDGSGNATVVNERTGTVTTRGTGARGLSAYSNSGTANSINRGTVRTSGGIQSGISELWRVSVGVSATSDGGDSSSENRGQITTSGTGARGMSASSGGGSGTVLVKNFGTVRTTGGTVHDADEISTASGIAAFRFGGGAGDASARNERGGSVEVSGAGAKGVWTSVYGGSTGAATVENSGTVTTRGNVYVADRAGADNDGYRVAAGLAAYAGTGNATATNNEGGTIETRGRGAAGMQAWTNGEGATARVSNSGTVRVFATDKISTIPGDAAEKEAAQSHGMVAVARKGNVQMSLSGGTVTAAGGGSGLHALTGSDGDITVTMDGGARVTAAVAARFVGGETDLTMTANSRLIGAVHFGDGADMADLTGSEIRGDISFGGGSDALILRAGSKIHGDMNFGTHSGNAATGRICGSHERGDLIKVNVAQAADEMASINGSASGLERFCKLGAGAVLVENVSMHGVRAAIENGTLVVKGHMDLGTTGMLTVYDRSKLQFEVRDLSANAANHGRITAGGGTTFADDDSDGNSSPDPNLELAFADAASIASARGKTITVIRGPVTGLSTGTAVGAKGGSASVGTTSVTGSGASMQTSIAIASNASLTVSPVQPAPVTPVAGVTCQSIVRGNLSDTGDFAPDSSSGSDYLFSCTGNNVEVDDAEFERLLDLADIPGDLVEDDSSRVVINLSGIDLSFDWEEYPAPEANEPKFKGGVVFTGSNIRYISMNIDNEEHDLNSDLKIDNYATVITGGSGDGGVSTWVSDPSTSHKVVLRNYGQVATDGSGSRYDGVEVGAADADVEVHNQAGGRVSTSGNAAQGLQATSDDGDALAVNRGIVTTSGDTIVATFESSAYLRRSYGVYSWSDNGNSKSENHGTVTTSGKGASGVKSTTEGASGTSEVRNFGTVTTTGDTASQSDLTASAHGLDAWSDSSGDVTAVNESAGAVITQGTGAVGVYASSGEGLALSVNRGSVSTAGAIAKTTGTNSVTILGSRAFGVYAKSNDGDVRSENHGMVTTSGEGARGVTASTSGASGSAEAKNFGTVTTSGGTVHDASAIAAADGLSAFSPGSGTAVATNERGGTINVAGDGAKGVWAAVHSDSGSGDATATNRGTVVTRGDLYIADRAGTANDDDRASSGVSAYSRLSDAKAVNDIGGTVSTHGIGASGVMAWTEGSDATAVVVNKGVISTSASDNPSFGEGGWSDFDKMGAGSHGVAAVSEQGDVQITLEGGSVSVGAGGSGVFAMTAEMATSRITLTMTKGAQVRGDSAAKFVGGPATVRMLGDESNRNFMYGTVSFGNRNDRLKLRYSEIHGDISFGRGRDRLVLNAGGVIRGDIDFGEDSGDYVTLSEEEAANLPKGCSTDPDNPSRGDMLSITVSERNAPTARIYGTVSNVNRFCKRGKGAALVQKDISFKGSQAMIYDGTLILGGHMDLGDTGTLTVIDSAALRFQIGDVDKQDYGRVTAKAVTFEDGDDEDTVATPNLQLSKRDTSLADDDVSGLELIDAGEINTKVGKTMTSTGDLPIFGSEGNQVGMVGTQTTGGDGQQRMTMAITRADASDIPLVQSFVDQQSPPDSGGGGSAGSGGGSSGVGGIAALGGLAVIMALLNNPVELPESPESSEESTDLPAEEFVRTEVDPEHRYRFQRGGIEYWARSFSGAVPAATMSSGGAKAQGWSIGMNARLDRGFVVGLSATPEVSMSSLRELSREHANTLVVGRNHALHGGYVRDRYFVHATLAEGVYETRNFITDPMTAGAVGGETWLRHRQATVATGFRKDIGRMRVVPRLSWFKGELDSGEYDATNALMRAEVPAMKHSYSGWGLGLSFASRKWLSSADSPWRWRPQLRLTSQRIEPVGFGSEKPLRYSDAAGALSFNVPAAAGHMPRTVVGMTAAVSALESKSPDSWQVKMGYGGAIVDGEYYHAVVFGAQKRF